MLPVQPQGGQGQTLSPTLQRWQTLNAKIQELLSEPTCQVKQLMSLIRATESYRKTGPPVMAIYETYTVAPEKELEGSRIARKGDPYPQVTPSSAKVMTIQRKCSSRSTTTLRCALPIFTDVSKEGWGTNLGEHTIRGTCSLPESRLHWSAVEGSGPSCLPTSSHLGQSAGEVSGLSVQQNYSDCSRVAHHALVLGPSDHVRSNSTVPAQSANPAI